MVNVGVEKRRIKPIHCTAIQPTVLMQIMRNATQITRVSVQEKKMLTMFIDSSN